MQGRVRILPAKGQLLVSTDLHGNFGDFEQLRAIFAELRAAAEDPSSVHWALLGDLVHGPSAAANRRDPVRFGYPDRSPELVEAVIELRARWPDNVHLVLGNHDHGHIGGPHPSKFHADEVTALEQRMTPAAIARMRSLFEDAMLALAAPCGLLLCHGSPGTILESLELLDGVNPVDEPDTYKDALLRSILTSYGQPGSVTGEMLDQIATPQLPLSVVVHGHDVALEGWYTEGGNQACPVLFGAWPAQKRYLVVDLAARYEHADELRVGHEVRRLYPDLSADLA